MLTKEQATTIFSKDLITSREVQDLILITPATLIKWRKMRGFPDHKFTDLGGGKPPVRFKPAEVLDWCREHKKKIPHIYTPKEVLVVA